MSATTTSRQSSTGAEELAGPTPIRSHRSPRLIGFGIALIAIGGLGAAWLATSLSATVGVVAVASTIDRGQVITSDDLTTASITLDPNLRPVGASALAELVGQRARYDLPAGSILTAESVTNDPIPAPGFSVVPVAVRGTGLPSEPIRPGSSVRVVDTPREGDEPPLSPPEFQRATVVDVGVDEETGHSVVTLTVPESVAPALAARAATGRIAIVLDGPASS